MMFSHCSILLAEFGVYLQEGSDDEGCKTADDCPYEEVLVADGFL